MRELPRTNTAASNPAFLLKALGEGSGEIDRLFYGLNQDDLLDPGVGPDEGWTLLAIPYHLREVEHGVMQQIEAILSQRDAPIPHVDFDAMPWRDLYCDEDAQELLDQFHYLRRHTSYALWELSDRQWERHGEHPYRGMISILDIAREMYQHDLEHLWQAQRMVESILGQVR
jgi:hypothetical protein